MAVGAPSRDPSRSRHFAAGPGRAVAVLLVPGAAAQLLALLYAYRAWDLPIPAPSAGTSGLLVALLLAMLPALHWLRLTRTAGAAGGIAPATAEALAPVAPLLGSIVLTCYWLGHCALAALATGMASRALGSLTGAPPGAWPDSLWAAVLLLLPCLPGLRRVRALLLAGALALALAALAWLVVHQLPLLPDGLPPVPVAFDRDAFGRASAWCAGLFLAGPSLYASEAVLSLPRGEPGGRDRAGLWLAMGLLATGALLVILLPELRHQGMPAGPAAVREPWARPVAALLALSAGVLALSLSRVAAGGALALLAGRRDKAQVARPAAAWLPLLTASATLGFVLLRQASWLFAGAGLAYFLVLAAVAAVRSSPLAVRSWRGLPAPRQAPGVAGARLAALVWLCCALLGLQAWGVQALLAGLMMVYGGALLHLARGLRDRRQRASVHAKLLAGMLLILALDGAGCLVAHEVLRVEDAASAALVADVFTGVALLTVLVGVVLPAMIVHALTQAADAAERLARSTVAGLREGIDLIGRGELDAMAGPAQGPRLHTPFRDEIGRIIASINILQDDVARAADGLHSARDKLRRSRAELFQQARHDPLTGLHNRRAFEEALARLVDDRRRHVHEHALLYLDLDQFKVVNDTCGHEAGDELLRQVSLLLAAQLRADDLLARLGGDEFGVALSGCTREDAIRIAESMVVAVREFTFGWQGRVFRIGVSIGVVAFRSGAITLTELLAAADKSCYCAKEQGRNRHHAYSPDDQEISTRSGEMQWVSRIHEAMEQGRLCLHAQPIVALAGTAASGHHELLLRMLDPAGELVPPMAFIPAAERFGAMSLLDRWVVRTALQRLGELTRDGGDREFGSLAINLSGASITDATFLEYVKEQFRLSGVPHGRIWFEISEASAIANLRAAKRFISELRALGCRFGLDDFGAGLSSFGYLRQLDVDFLKIDGAFVQDMADDPVDRAVVEAINRIGQLMGLATIAAFVGDARAITLLRSMGVDMMQGNGVAPPVPFAGPFLQAVAAGCSGPAPD